LEIRKNILKIIERDNEYKKLLGSYRNLNNLIKKDPIGNFINIRKHAENFEKHREFLLERKPTKTREQPSIKSKMEKINVKGLSKKTVKELREICQKNGIKGYSKANKTILIKKIKEMVKSEKQGAENTNPQINKELENYAHTLRTQISQWKEKFRSHLNYL